MENIGAHVAFRSVVFASFLVLEGFCFRVSSAPARGGSYLPADQASAARPVFRARLELQAKRPLTATAPLLLLPIGERDLLISEDKAELLSADAGLNPVAGWRNPRDFGSGFTAPFAWVVGGMLSNRPVAEVWRVQLAGEVLEWTRLAALPAPALRPAVVASQGDLFVAGRLVTGTPFFIKVRTVDGLVDQLRPPAEFQDALSLGKQGDYLCLLGQDRRGTQRFWRYKQGAWQEGRRPLSPVSSLAPVPMGQSHLLYAPIGQSDVLLAYHTITDTWSPLAAAEGETLAMVLNSRGLLSVVKESGGTTVLRTEVLVQPKRGLTFIDYVTLAGYFGLNLGIGFLCAKRKATSDEYFRGSGRLQWWALGISYMATGMSSISFMAYPATAYATNWLMLGVPVFQSAAVVVAAILFIRMLRRLNITTVFEYLERRFGRSIRWLGAALMVLSQVCGRLSIVMLLPSMAFSAVTGLNVYASVFLMGVVTIIYCLKGGMKAVVWTDVLQFFLMYGAIAVVVVTVTQHVPGGFAGLLSVARSQAKFESVSFNWDFVRPTIWVFACLAVTTVFLQLSDQALMQRALSAPDEKAARNSVALAGVLNVPISFMLFFIGSALFVYYRQYPGLLDPTLPNDSIFPYFVGTELPHGVVGLIIAGIFAAAMSTVSGSVNAISAIVVRDFLGPLRPDCGEAGRMKLARITTVVVGAVATVIAAGMASMNLQSLWETFAALIALIGGGFPGIFALGLLTRRANTPGVAIGLAASMVVTFAVKHYTATNVFLFTSVAVGSCMTVGYLASLCFGWPKQALEGLTIYTQRGKPAAVVGVEPVAEPGSD